MIKVGNYILWRVKYWHNEIDVHHQIIGKVSHILREDNIVTYRLTNDALDIKGHAQLVLLLELPRWTRRGVKLDKTRLPNIRNIKSSH